MDISRGDIVSYHAKHYFYQQIGFTHYLYNNPDSIGKTDEAVIKIYNTTSLFLVKKSYQVNEDDKFNVKMKQFIQLDTHDEDFNDNLREQELWRIIDNLSARIAYLEGSVRK